jgi:hypothetical protein
MNIFAATTMPFLRVYDGRANASAWRFDGVHFDGEQGRKLGNGRAGGGGVV